MKLSKILIGLGGGSSSGSGGSGGTSYYLTMDNTNRRFTFPLESGYPVSQGIPAVYNYEYSIDSGVTWVDALDNTVELPYGTYGIGTLRARRKGFSLHTYVNPTALTPLTIPNVGKINWVTVGDSNSTPTTTRIEAHIDHNKYFGISETNVTGTKAQGYAGWTAGPITSPYSILSTVTEDIMRSIFDPTVSVNIMRIMIGTNDLNNGGVYQDLITYVKAIHARAHKVGFVTIGGIFSNGQNPWHPVWDYNPFKSYMQSAQGQREVGFEALEDHSTNSNIAFNTYAGGNPDWWNAGYSGAPDGLHYDQTDGNIPSTGYEGIAVNLSIPTFQTIEDRRRYLPPTPTVVRTSGNTLMSISNLDPFYIPTKDLVYTTDGWTTYQDVTTYPVPINSGTPANQVGLQIKPINGNMPSARATA